MSLLAALVGATPVAAAATARSERLVVSFDHGTPATTQARSLRGAGLRSATATTVTDASVPHLATTIVTVPVADVAATRAKLLATPGVRNVEIDRVAHALWNPGDPRLSEQWGLAAMGLPTAWDTTRGNGVTIAVVDTGVSYIHEELWGKVDKGYDFVDDDADPMDVQGHGTHVSGIAAGFAGNGRGGAGVAPGARILAVRVLDGDGAGYYSWIANGIVYAADHGAKVINLSLGGPESADILREAIGYAAAKGAVVTCAAGNDGTADMGYPARYDGCLSVGATTSAGKRASFSDYGTGLDVMAPGEGILSSTSDGSYESWDGTSMATPFVSGLAALLFSQGLSRRQVIDTIEATAGNMGPAGYDTTTGYGAVNAAAAVARARQIGPLVSDAAAPTVTGVSLGSISRLVSESKKATWKTTKRTKWRVVGQSDYAGAWNWSETSAHGSRRTVKFFRMKHHVVRQRTVVQRRVVAIKRTSTAFRNIVVAATDNVGVDRVSLTIDGHWVATDLNAADGWVMSFACSPGTHQFTAHAFDAHDQEATRALTATVTC